MSALNNVLLIVHLFSAVGILVLLLMQINKSPRAIPVGTLHTALTALVAGTVMVGIRGNLHSQDAIKWEEFDQAKVGVKFLILAVIIFLIIKFQKAPQVKSAIWLSLIGLTTANILIAVLW